MKKVAIVLPFNDIDTFQGGSRKGLKSSISYFDQFLVLYESILKNWKKKAFDYNIYVLHSIPFSPQKQRILSRLDVNVIPVKYKNHPLKIRPMAYLEEIDCDFRLILDVDMYVLNQPKFDFEADAQAMYGGNKYSHNQWVNICEYLKCKMPSQEVLVKEDGSYRSWSYNEHFLYNSGSLSDRIFPYFNNGAILIKNGLAPKLAQRWDELRTLYTEYVKQTQHLDIDLEGQDVMGVAINSITENWKPFSIGMNFILQSRFEESKKLQEFIPAEEISLFHYINPEADSPYYQIVLDEYNMVRKKHYKKWFNFSLLDHLRP